MTNTIANILNIAPQYQDGRKYRLDLQYLQTRHTIRLIYQSPTHKDPFYGETLALINAEGCELGAVSGNSLKVGNQAKVQLANFIEGCHTRRKGLRRHNKETAAQYISDVCEKITSEKGVRFTLIN